VANTIFTEFAMMGHESDVEPKLYFYRVNLEQRVPGNHIFRKIQKKIDFEFIYDEVKDTYGDAALLQKAQAI
jgi:hypothetical protein